ncbi:MAG: TonB-dependent receptor [Sphingomonas sp.]|uniref:TonB-dependent receptor plug domain-containing protein n=1 Tax=Sphingomonas sp. TaxID=28214 RepID=UPI001B0AD8E0|nr:TonB-dependent receptor [Sphingomonas sp.]MBO9621115.1 TonB-dependent receptor [Sphingomonas sp.]
MKKYKLFLSATAALLPFAAHAQSDEPIVVVATGVEQSPDEIGRSVTLIGRDEIETHQTVALSDLLATTPGVTVTRNGGLGGFTGVRIRGAEAEQTLVLIDGVRVNDPSAPGGGFDFGNLLAGSIERVEVLRGPNSVAWGSQAIGGVVNVVTERPVDGLRVRGNAEYGSNEQFGASGALSAGNERVQGALTAGYLTTDGISQAASGTEPDGYRQIGGTARVLVEFAPGFGADLRGYYAHSRLDLDGFPAPTYAFADTEEYSEAQEAYGYVGLHGVTGPVKHRLSFTLADVNRDNYDPASGSDASFFSRGRSERYAYQGEAALGSVARLVFGAEQEDSRFFDGSTRASQGITSVYGEAIVTPVEPLTLTAGLRNDDHSGFGSHMSWGANAALRPAAGTLLHASYGEGFKAPTLYQRFSFYGTPDLQPETAESYEVGARQEITKGLSLGATWFRRDTRQQIDFDLATSTYFNIARSRARGVEVEIVAQPVTGLSLRGGYTHVDAENRSPGANLGNDLPRRPRDTGSLSVDYRFAHGPSLGATLLIVDDSFDNAANTVRLDGYALASIRASVPVTRQVELYGRVENLFDADYQTVAGYGTFGRTAHAGVRLRFD